jgi:hypothetical protein
VHWLAILAAGNKNAARMGARNFFYTPNKRGAEISGRGEQMANERLALAKK